jgi:hypothetical protein
MEQLHMLSKLATLLEVARSIAQLPTADLRFETHKNPDNAEKIYRHFTKRHPRYLLCRNKTLGAALVDLHKFDAPSAYMASVTGRNSADKHSRRARSRGYRVIEIDRNDYIDEIHHINTSVDVRQGQTMGKDYLIKQTRYVDECNYKYYGTVDLNGVLVAYGEIGYWGNFAAFNRIIGVRNNDGIMHLLVTEIICQMIEKGEYRYLMYDTYFGASPGMKIFKTTLGFAPYRARYSIL